MRNLLVSIAALGFAAMLSFSGTVAAMPTLTTIGEGSYRYLFWHLYEARLASPDGKFNDYQQTSPLLLELTYQRDISKEQFIDATVEQWQKLGHTNEQQQASWAQTLALIWRDVKKGDRLAALLTEQGIVQFYLNDNDIGSVDDKAFAPAFFDIWLHPETSAPKLRNQLLAAN